MPITLFSYTINGVAAQKQIQRQSFGTTDNQPRLNVRDMWWAGPDQLRLKSENGWGVTIAQQERQLFGVWFTYDADGKTTWFVMPGGTWAGTTFIGDLFSTTSSPWLGTVYNPAALAVSKVGSVTFTFLSADAAMMTYTVNGVTQSKRITRQPF
jgi:chitinase